MITHQTIYSVPGRCGGWPANCGAWQWGDELLVGFHSAPHEPDPDAFHQVPFGGGYTSHFARSLDGGETWAIETPRDLNRSPRMATSLDVSMQFDEPGFCMTLRCLNHHHGPSFFFYSYNRGRTWRGPFGFPAVSSLRIAARTDYIITGPSSMLAFLTAAKSDGREGRTFCAATEDGGLTWEFRGWTGEEPGEGEFAIMPSSVRLSDKSILTAVRERTIWGSVGPETYQHNSLETYLTDDDGRTWDRLHEWSEIDTGGKSGNPPHLIRLQDGRLCLTYGYRAEPYEIYAVLADEKTLDWGEPIVIRSGAACHDMGYVRTLQRTDGKLMSVYYWNTTPTGRRTIEATIWEV